MSVAILKFAEAVLVITIRIRVRTIDREDLGLRHLVRSDDLPMLCACSLRAYVVSFLILDLIDHI